MTLLDVDISLDTLESLLGEIPCGNPHHLDSMNKCKAEEPGSYVMLNPCCGDRAVICWSRANYLKNESPQIRCHRCGREWPPGAYRFIPVRPNVDPI